MDTPNEERVRQLTEAVILYILRKDVRQDRESPTLLKAIDDLGYSQGEDETIREITENMKYIADMVNAQLDEKVVKRLQENFDENTFKKVAENFKAVGGMESWGGVATFICLSCKIATKLAKSLGILQFVQIIGWILDYVKVNLVPWIMSVGGWLAVFGHRSTAPGWSTVAIFILGVLTGSAIVYKVMKQH